jgi:transcriptional regulator
VRPAHCTVAGDELLVCRATVVDDPQGKAEILTAQLADFQPEGRHAAVVLQVDAKFKYDDANPVEHCQRVIGHLEQRGHGLDARAAAQQQRRLARSVTGRPRRERP